MPPPRALIRSMFRSVIVSAWSKNQRRPVERHLAVDRLEHVEEAADRLVVGGVQPERPAVLDQEPHHAGSVPASIDAGRSGRGSRKSSKSAAEKTSISPAPFMR